MKAEAVPGAATRPATIRAAAVIAIVLSAALPAWPSVPPATVPSAALRAPQALTIEYIAHACFRLQSAGGASVLIDPYASRVWLGYDFPVGVAADVVLITHPHYDHDAGVRRGLPFPWDETIPVVTEPGEYRFGDIRVVGIRGKHADPYGREFGQKNTVFVIEADGLRVAHVGDNGPLGEDVVRQMGGIDVLMLPIDADYHILSESEVDAMIAAVAPRVVVPMHYRIDELEADADSPSDLGEIGPWLAGRSGVRRLAGNVVALDPAQAAALPQILVFEPSPAVARIRRD